MNIQLRSPSTDKKLYLNTLLKHILPKLRTIYIFNRTISHILYQVFGIPGTIRIPAQRSKSIIFRLNSLPHRNFLLDSVREEFSLVIVEKFELKKLDVITDNFFWSFWPLTNRKHIKNILTKGSVLGSRKETPKKPKNEKIVPLLFK